MNQLGPSQAALPLFLFVITLSHGHAKQTLHTTANESGRGGCTLMYCKCCRREQGLDICCFGDIEASSFVIIVIIPLASQSALGGVQEQQSSKKPRYTGTSHDLRLLRPHTSNRRPGLESVCLAS